MKTKMFKKFSPAEKAVKIKKMLRKRCDWRLPEEIAEKIALNVDIENQFQIIYITDFNDLLDETIVLNVEEIVDGNYIATKDITILIEGKGKFGMNICSKRIENGIELENNICESKPQISSDEIFVFQRQRNQIKDNASTWHYSIIIYIPSNMIED